MKKTYSKGYKYWLYQSLYRPTTIVVLENTKSFGNGHLEAHIICRAGEFDMAITDGFKILECKIGYSSLKSAMNHAHAKMESMK